MIGIFTLVFLDSYSHFIDDELEDYCNELDSQDLHVLKENEKTSTVV